jgi:hypothetical protein
MDDEGVTLEVSPGITSFAAFQNARGASEKTGDGSVCSHENLKNN